MTFKAALNQNEMYKWSVVVFDSAKKEIEKAFSAQEYYHLIDQVRVLATEENPLRPQLLEVRTVEDFYELRELGTISGRVFFNLDPKETRIVVLGGMKKKSQKTPLAIKIRIQRRWYQYLDR